MKRSQIVVLMSLVCLLAVLALPSLARAADQTPDGWTWDEAGWTWDEVSAPSDPDPDGWTWDEAATPAEFG
jgi:hypothetical protein